MNGRLGSVFRIGLIVLILATLAGGYSYLRQSSPTGAVKDNRLEKRNVSLVLAARHGDYWKTVYMGAEAAARELGVNLSLLAPDKEEDAPGQLVLIRQTLQDGAHALVLASVADPAVEATVGAIPPGVPVVAIDTVLKASRVKSFIGTDHEEAGRIAGQELLDQLTAGGQARWGADITRLRVAILGDSPRSEKAQLREKGVRTVWGGLPDLQVMDTLYTYGDQSLAADLTRQLLLKEAHLDGLVALTPAAALGAAEALKELRLSGGVKLVAFDSTLQELELLQEGVIDATIVQSPFAMGYLGVKHAVEALGGRKVPAVVDTDSKVVRSEQMFSADNQKLLFPLIK